MDKAQLNDLAHEVVDAALEVHRELGPGLLEGFMSGRLSMNWEFEV